jgi:hypothetical protein
MRRFWPEELKSVFETAEEVTLKIAETPRDGASPTGRVVERQALRIRLTEEDYQRIWPLAEKRYRLDGRFAGKAVTLIVNNPHYHAWHPVDGGTEERKADSGVPYTIKYITAHLLLDDVREEAVA